MDNNTRSLVAMIRSMSGRAYPPLEAALKEMSPEVLSDFRRLLRDLEAAADAKARRAALEPWRHGR